MMATMKAAVFEGKKTDRLQVITVPKPKPALGQVLVKVHACGICYADADVMYGGLRQIARFPVIPGHEVMGTVAERGEGVNWPEVGARVGIPYLNSSCNHCDMCCTGDQMLCTGEKGFTGINTNGGFAEFVIALATHVVPVPDELDFATAAPLMCAGVTVFNGLREGGMKFGDKVAVLATGGLGQLGIQFARAMGGTVAAVSRSRTNEQLARTLGASHFIATNETPVAEALQKWGGANIIINTAPTTGTANEAMGGLAPRGTMVILGLDSKPVNASSFQLVMQQNRVMGVPSGSPHDIRDALRFAVDHHIIPNVTQVTLEDAAGVCDRMLNGTQQGRCVIVF